VAGAGARGARAVRKFVVLRWRAPAGAIVVASRGIRQSGRVSKASTSLVEEE